MKKAITTSTATLVVFDPERLKHRLNDEDDWWSDPREEIHEINHGNALFVGLGSDGRYELDAQLGPTTDSDDITVLVHNSSGTFVIGPGEEVVAGGLAPDRSANLFLSVAPGVYRVGVRGEGQSIFVRFESVSSFVRNEYATSPRLNSPTVQASSAPRSIQSDDLLEMLDAGEDDPRVAGLVCSLGATQRRTDDDSLRIVCGELGLELVFAGGRLCYVHLHDQCEATRTHAAFRRWPFPMPDGLAFGMTDAQVASRLGTPLHSGPLWALYDRERYGLRVGFLGGKLSSVNLLSNTSRILTRFRSKRPLPG